MMQKTVEEPESEEYDTAMSQAAEWKPDSSWFLDQYMLF